MGIHLLRMLKQGLILATLLVLGQARPKMDSQWKHYKTKYMKNYVLGEEEMRRAIWEDNHEFIMRHNAAYEAGNETYSVGENEYTEEAGEKYWLVKNSCGKTCGDHGYIK